MRSVRSASALASSVPLFTSFATDLIVFSQSSENSHFQPRTACLLGLQEGKGGTILGGTPLIATHLNKYATTPRLSERTGVENSPSDIPLPLTVGCQIVRLTKEEAGHDQCGTLTNIN